MKPQLCAFLLLLITSACRNKNPVKDWGIDSSALNKKIEHTSTKTNISQKVSDTVLLLKYGFKVISKNTHLELWHDQKEIFNDTTLEYEFNDKQYPILNKLQLNTFELLIEFDDRPSKDKLLLLRIKDNNILKTDTIPTFDSKGEKINGLLVYSGAWDNGEEWDEKGKRYTSFDPEIYFKFTPEGVKLDSVLTRARTREEFGNVDPFDNKYEIGFPIDTHGNIDTIAKHILKKRLGEY